MPAQFSAVRDALKVRLQTIPGLTAYDTVPGKINPPAAVVIPGETVITYDAAFDRQADNLSFVIRVLVSASVDYAGQDDLDAFLNGTGPSSIKQAIDGDLGGLVDDASVTQARDYRDYDVGGVKYLGVEFVVEVAV